MIIIQYDRIIYFESLPVPESFPEYAPAVRQHLFCYIDL